MQPRNSYGNARPPAGPPVRSPKPEPEREGIRRCPVCDGWVDRVKVDNSTAILLCRDKKDWALGFVAGYRLTPDPMPDPCEAGHQECWRGKEVGRVRIMCCAFMTQSRDGKRWFRCGRRLVVGQLQGFLDPDKVSRAPLDRKDRVLLGLYLLGTEGGRRGPLAKASGLSLPDLDSALSQYLKAKEPHIVRGDKREPLPVRDYAYRYKLSERGWQYLRARWDYLCATYPELFLLNESTNGVNHHAEVSEGVEVWPA